MTNARFAFEALESRQLMSVSPFNAAVKLDRLEVRLDLLKFNVDLYTDAAKLKTDNAALRHDKLGQNTVLEPLVQTLRTDVKNFSLTLKMDRLNEASNVIGDELVVVGDLKQILHDKGNAAALAADKTKLITDRAQTQTDMVAGITQRIDDREAETATLLTDAQNILTALPTSGASTQLTADLTVWLGDKGASLNKLTSDLEKLSSARSQLITDLNAENT